MRRFGRARLLGALAVAVATGALPPAPSAGAACARVTVESDWASIAAPPFGAGPPTIRAFDVAALDPETMYVTNGRAVMRTTDGGCSWRKVFRVELLPRLDVFVAPSTATVVDIAVPERDSSQVFLLISEDLGPVTRPHVLVGDDRGEGWTQSDRGLPLVAGNLLRLHAAPSDSRVTYLLVRTSPASSGVTLYRSDEGGTRWEQGEASPFAASDFLVDPLRPDDLWLYGPSGVARSSDGGRSIVPTSVTGATPAAALVHPPGRPPLFMGYDPDGGTIVLTPDGSTIDRIGAPSNFLLSLATAGDLNSVVASTHQGFYRFVAPRYWVDIARPDQHRRDDITDLVIDRTRSPSVFGRTPHSIERYRGLSDAVDVGDFDLAATALRTALPSLTPRKVVRRIGPGRTERVRYRLRVPPESAGLDVFFLVDTTKSMGSSIDGLRRGMQNIADHLARTGIDVQFGVGEYKDYPIAGYGEPLEGDYPYRLLAKVGPVGPALEAGLEALTAGGGGDEPEATLTALYQAATGSGEEPFVPPGRGAGFRPGALEVIVNITDAAFHTSPAHPSPGFSAVAKTLRAGGVAQIGLAVYGPNGPDAIAHLTAMAEATRAFAPEGGVDCDGDGAAEVPPGSPLVCRVDDYRRDVLNLAPAIVATLEALRREVPVELEVRRGRELVSTVEASASRVNALAPARVGFDVAFTCPRSLVRSAATVALAGAVAGQDIASARARIVCLPQKPTTSADERPAPSSAPPAAPSPALNGALAVPPAPPGPLLEHAPGAQSNPAAQTGLAEQEEEQQEVAVAHQGVLEPEAQENLSFAAYSARRTRTAPGPAFIGAATAMFLAAAYAVRGRGQIARAGASSGSYRNTRLRRR